MHLLDLVSHLFWPAWFQGLTLLRKVHHLGRLPTLDEQLQIAITITVAKFSPEVPLCVKNQEISVPESHSFSQILTICSSFQLKYVGNSQQNTPFAWLPDKNCLWNRPVLLRKHFHSSSGDKSFPCLSTSTTYFFMICCLYIWMFHLTNMVISMKKLSNLKKGLDKFKIGFLKNCLL